MQEFEKILPTEIKIICSVKLPRPRAASSTSPSLLHVIVFITLNKGYIDQESIGHLNMFQICFIVLEVDGIAGSSSSEKILS